MKNNLKNPDLKSVQVDLSLEFRKRLLKRFKHFLDNNHLCNLDLIAAIDGKKISVHRIIMAAANPHFEEILSAEGTDLKEICMYGVNGKSLRLLVDFCYTGEFKITVDNVINLLAAASRYRFVAVEKHCLDFLERLIGTD